MLLVLVIFLLLHNILVTCHGVMAFLQAIGCCIIICAGKAVTIVNIAVDVVMYVSDFCCCVSTY